MSLEVYRLHQNALQRPIARYANIDGSQSSLVPVLHPLNFPADVAQRGKDVIAVARRQLAALQLSMFPLPGNSVTETERRSDVLNFRSSPGRIAAVIAIMFAIDEIVFAIDEIMFAIDKIGMVVVV